MEQTYRQRTAQDHKAELDQILSSYKVMILNYCDVIFVNSLKTRDARVYLLFLECLSLGKKWQLFFKWQVPHPTYFGKTLHYICLTY